MQKIFGGGSNAAAVDVKALIANGAKLVDVRTPGEFAEGYAEGAINIPLQDLQRQLPKMKSWNVPVVAYCRSGNRSGIAAQILQANGMEAYNAGSLGQVNALLK
ncbi:MAG: rhodanese-like domain-containing protein [Phaeodactylibacter sp.]|nr:rhodanese-like domain-containing protein [Phaeodactylibacter sp.]